MRQRRGSVVRRPGYRWPVRVYRLPGVPPRPGLLQRHHPHRGRARPGRRPGPGRRPHPDRATARGEAGLHLARVENTRTGITADQVRGWCANPDTEVVIKPVIDLNEHIHVDAYEVPDRLSEQSQQRDHRRVRVVHQTCEEVRRRALCGLRPERDHVLVQPRPVVPATSPTQDPLRVDLHHPGTRVVPVDQPVRVAGAGRPSRHRGRLVPPAATAGAPAALLLTTPHRPRHTSRGGGPSAPTPPGVVRPGFRRAQPAGPLGRG
jgi:hypothetical protein